MAELTGRPRAYLLGHLASVMQTAPALQAAIREATDADIRGWTEFYEATVDAVGLRWRPGWSATRAQVVVQSLIDGLLIRSRVVGRTLAGEAWDPADLFADAVTALFASVLDLDADGRPVAQVLDDGVARSVARA